MSGTLIVWKAPPVEDEDAAARLLHDFYATGDESAFEPSDDVARFYDDLMALYPPLEDVDVEDVGLAPSWSSTPERSDRVVCLNYSWSAPDALLSDVERLAREHGLVLYDPQGPAVLDPDDPHTEYVPSKREILRVTLICLGGLLVAIGAWYASITVLSWVVIAVAGFLALMAAYTLCVYVRQAQQRHRS
jgi:hypothetical protein